MVRREWDDVRARCEAVLAFDPANVDAREYLAAVERRPGEAAGLTPPPAPPAPAAPNLPASFANGRFVVQALLGEGGRKVSAA